MILFVALHGIFDAVERSVVVMEENVAAAAEAQVEVAAAFIDRSLEVHIDGHESKGCVDVLHGLREVALAEDDAVFMLHLLHHELLRGVLISIHESLRCPAAFPDLLPPAEIPQRYRIDNSFCQ